MKKTLAITIIALAITGCAHRGTEFVPLVDNKGKDQAELDKNIAECQEFSKQAMSTGTGAATGAVAGAVIGAILGGGLRSQARVAGTGAALGAAGGAGRAVNTQENVTRRCLAGRGYKVLN